MAYVVGLFDRDELARIKEAEYEVMAEGAENVVDFMASGIVDPEGETEDLIYAIVAVDADAEELLQQ